MSEPLGMRVAWKYGRVTYRGWDGWIAANLRDQGHEVTPLYAHAVVDTCACGRDVSRNKIKTCLDCRRRAKVARWDATLRGRLSRRAMTLAANPPSPRTTPDGPPKTQPPREPRGKP